MRRVLFRRRCCERGRLSCRPQLCRYPRVPGSKYNVCVRMLVHVCPHTTLLLYMLRARATFMPRSTLPFFFLEFPVALQYVSSYYHCILLYMCLHTTVYLRPHTTLFCSTLPCVRLLYVSTYYCILFLIQLYICVRYVCLPTVVNTMCVSAC